MAPGFINTAMTEVLPEETKKNYLASIPAGRFAEAQEVAPRDSAGSHPMRLAPFLALSSLLMAAWAWVTNPTPYGLHEAPGTWAHPF